MPIAVPPYPRDSDGNGDSDGTNDGHGDGVGNDYSDGDVDPTC
jgi:hypothetical protein